MRAMMTGAAGAMLLGAGAMAQVAPRADASFVGYAASGCYGACPAYSIVVYADGRGSFHGDRNTAVIGDRVFRVTPAQYAAFRRRVERFRAGDMSCESRATDQATVTLRWHDRQGSRTRNIYFGCDMRKNATAFAALRDAPDVLPIAPFVGQR